MDEHADQREREELIETLRQDAQMLRRGDPENILTYSEGVADNIDAAADLLTASKPEPQAQAVEPEVVAWIDEFGNVYPKSARRAPSWVNEHQKGWKEIITLQSHREAMAEQHEIEAQLSGQLEATSRACTEKDAALKACVEAMEYHTEQTRPIYKTEQAIAKAQEALK